jgi:hypothetical protein
MSETDKLVWFYFCVIIVIAGILLFLFIRYKFVVPYLHRKRWRNIVCSQYRHSVLSQRLQNIHELFMMSWLLSKEAERVYISNVLDFDRIYTVKLKETEEQVIKQLTQEYIDEYKSRNKKDSPAI